MFDEEDVTGEAEPIRVVIIEDNPLIRNGFRVSCKSADPLMTVVAEYDDPDDFFDDSDMAPEHVDVVVLDLQYGVHFYPPIWDRSSGFVNRGSRLSS